MSDLGLSDETVPPDSFVYAIAGAGLVKIGTTNDLALRLGQLRAMSPVHLELIGSGRAGFAEESSLHRRFAPQRHHGEWFMLSDVQVREVLDFLFLADGLWCRRWLPVAVARICEADPVELARQVPADELVAAADQLQVLADALRHS